MPQCGQLSRTRCPSLEGPKLPLYVRVVGPAPPRYAQELVKSGPGSVVVSEVDKGDYRPRATLAAAAATATPILVAMSKAHFPAVFRC